MERLPLAQYALVALLIAAACGRATAGQAEFEPDRIIVRLGDGLSKPSAAVDAVMRRYALSDGEPVLSDGRAHRPSRGGVSQWMIYRTTGHPPEVAEALRAVGLDAQPNYLYRPLAAPDDPRLGEQWALENIGFGEVWEYLRDASRDSVIVGVIDTGVDYAHPDLNGRMWRNLSEVNGLPGVDDDGNGYVDDHIGWDFTDAPGIGATGDFLDRDNDPADAYGHGTSVAGVVAAEADDGVGIAGVAPTARIMALRAGAEFEFGGAFLQEDDIASAIVYGVENGAQVINMSFGDLVSTPLMHDAMRFAAEGGVVLVGSAGNERSTGLLYPAAYDEVIAVGSIDVENELSHFASWGDNMDLVAPGSGILTLNFDGQYAHGWGTSLSGPHVTAACAILLSLAPELTPLEVRSMIRAATIDIGEPGWDPLFGAGRLYLPTLLGVSTAPVVEITAPERPDGADASVDWSFHVTGIPPIAWHLDYGPGTDPRAWTASSSGVVEVPDASLGGELETAELPDTVYAFRLTATDAVGNTREDRTLLSVDHSAPEFVMPPEPEVRWLDDAPALFLSWTADDVSWSEVIVTYDDNPGDEPERLNTELEADEMLVELPRDMSLRLPGSAIVRLTNRAGLSTDSAPVSLSAPRHRIARTGFELRASLPSGTVMPGARDYDGNGLPEIAVKTDDRAAYDTVSFYELSPGGGVNHRFDVPEAMRPSATSDLDGDGLLELIGIDHTTGAFRVSVLEQPAAAAAPTRVAFWGPQMVGPSVQDSDGDGREDLIVLVEPDRTELAVLEAASSVDDLARVATLKPEASETPKRFGIWRAVGDFDGDGKTEVAAGTESGDVHVFESGGDNSFSEIRVIEGEGDATRVWGGVDVTGDGLPNFAVLSFRGDDAFFISRRRFQLDVYGPSDEPVLTHVFSDPRTDGNGFTTGPVGPDGADALVFAIPPRLYAVSRESQGVGGLVWFAETGRSSQPLAVDLDGSGGAELLFNGPDSALIMGRRPPDAAPEAPHGVEVDVVDSVAVEVYWNREPGPAYRIWMGSDETSLAPLADAADSQPFVIAGLTDGVPIAVAVQAVNRSIPDSLGVVSDAVTVTPHSGPRVVSASLVGDRRAIVEVDAHLWSGAIDPRYYEIMDGGETTSPSSVILDRTGRRVVLGFREPIAASGTPPSLTLTVRDTTGASRSTTVALLPVGDGESLGLAYAVAVSSLELELGFLSPVDPASISHENVRAIGGPAVSSVAAADGDGVTFRVMLSAGLPEDATTVISVHDARTQTGATFDADAMVSSRYVSPAGPVRITAVIHRSADTLWVVTSLPLDHALIARGDAIVTPGVTVRDVLAGPSRWVTVIVLHPDTPVGPWRDEYRVGLVARFSDGTDEVLDATFEPIGTSVMTGHLLAADPLDDTTIRLTFDVGLAPLARQPVGAIDVEPGLTVEAYSVDDSVAIVSLSDRSRLGPWGMTYFVHVEGLLDADGKPLTELFGLRLEPGTDLSRLTVFPQPFLPAQDANLVFGGLPPDTDVRIYRLDGSLVREIEGVETGGVRWDGTNDSGSAVGSGIYLYVVESESGRELGKIAVVR